MTDDFLHLGKLTVTLFIISPLGLIAANEAPVEPLHPPN